MIESPQLARLIDSLRCLPGVGKKSAQRMAYHLLQKDRDGGHQLAICIQNAIENIDHCQRCRTLSETPKCQLCSSSKRDSSLLCVVESPADIVTIEQSDYNGLYFVLMGNLSPLDNIGPDEIGLDELDKLISEGNIKELILATNTTMEGEATAYFIGESAKKRNLKTTRLAHGIPIGGGLEYVNNSTIIHAVAERREI